MINYEFLFEEKQNDFQEIISELRSGKGHLIVMWECREWEQNHFK